MTVESFWRKGESVSLKAVALHRSTAIQMAPQPECRRVIELTPNKRT